MSKIPLIALALAVAGNGFLVSSTVRNIHGLIEIDQNLLTTLNAEDQRIKILETRVSQLEHRPAAAPPSDMNSENGSADSAYAVRNPPKLVRIPPMAAVQKGCSAPMENVSMLVVETRN